MLTKGQTLAACVGAALSSACLVGSADVVMSTEDKAINLEIHDLHVVEGALDGSIINHTNRRLEDIILRIKYDWLWRDEFHPGEVSPGWSFTQTVPAVLAPGESYKFHFETDHPATPRGDGRFTPSVSVVSYTEYSRLGDQHNEAAVAE